MPRICTEEEGPGKHVKCHHTGRQQQDSRSDTVLCPTHFLPWDIQLSKHEGWTCVPTPQEVMGERDPACWGAGGSSTADSQAHPGGPSDQPRASLIPCQLVLFLLHSPQSHEGSGQSFPAGGWFSTGPWGVSEGCPSAPMCSPLGNRDVHSGRMSIPPSWTGKECTGHSVI